MFLAPDRLNIFLSDFKQSYKFVVYILEKRLHNKKSELSRLVHQAFNTSLIISYSRPFKLNKELLGQSKSSLKQHVGEVLNEDEIKLHEKVIDKRDTAYGHSDARAHLLEGLDYNDSNSKRIKLMKYPFAPLNETETQRLKIMIKKWITYVKGEQSKLKS